jgi:hypothetical protein
MKKIAAMLLIFLFPVLLIGCIAGDRPDGKQSSIDPIVWPGWVPSMIPEYRYGEIVRVDEFEYGGSPKIVNIQMDKNPFESYRKELEDKGWVISYEFETEEGEFGIGLVQDENNLIYSFTDDGKGGFAVMITWELQNN